MKLPWFLSLILAASLLAACSQAGAGIPTAVPSLDSLGVADQAIGASSEGESTEASEMPSEVASGSYVLVDTGQDFCYGDSGSMACPSAGAAYFGQDGQYAGNDFRFQDNGDGTVTDLVTGLMWQQDPGEKTDYATAAASADSFTLAGYDDWRLPSIKELYSLIDFSGMDASNATDTVGLVPFIDATIFGFEYGDESGGARIIDSQWTTSTIYQATVMGNQECFFGVNFADGRIKCYPLEPGGSGGYFTLYVRGDAYGVNSFVENANGTVTDEATGLTWQQADSGSPLGWGDALAYCANLSLGGSEDWRLPNAKELQSIVDYERSPESTNSAALDPIFAATTITNEAGQSDWGFYWASTTHLKHNGASDQAVYVVFGRGLGYMQEFGGWVDVHGAGSQRSDPKTGSAADYPTGNGPQGDAVRIQNMVRCVSGGSMGDPLVGGELDPNSTSSGTSGTGVPTPPQEAIDACSGLAAGDACSIGPNAGTCTNLGGSLACEPEGGGGG